MKQLFSIFLIVTMVTVTAMAEAQQQTKLPKIGWLSAVSSSSPGQGEIVRILGDLGHVDGKNIAFEYRYAHNKLDQLPALANELVRLKAVVLLTPGTPGASFQDRYKNHPHRFRRCHQPGCGWTG